MLAIHPEKVRQVISEARVFDAKEEQIELVALAWVGRGTYGASDWDEAVAEAHRAHNKRTAEYLTSLPMLGDYLEEGLAAIEQKDAEEGQSNLVERVGPVTAAK